MPNATSYLPSPYGKGNAESNDELSRTSVDLSYADKKTIRSVCPDNGILNRMGQLFFHAIAEDLRRLDIKYYSPQNEQQLIESIRRRTDPSLVAKATVGDDHGGTSSGDGTTPKRRGQSKRTATKTTRGRRTKNEDKDIRGEDRKG